MGKQKASWKNPGFLISGGLHGLGLILLLVNVDYPEKLPDAKEAISVDMVSMSELNEIMNGEKTAKVMPKPQRRVDKLAALEENKPAPPLAEAKKDTPSEDSPDKPTDDPGEAEKPPQVVAAPPPPASKPDPVAPTPPQRPIAKLEPPRPEQTKPEPVAPMPPERPVAKLEPSKTEAPSPPPKPDDTKPPPDAEALAPTPPPRPKRESKTEAKRQVQPKHEPVAKPAPHPLKEAQVVPTPPKLVRPREPAKPNVVDQVAKLLDSMKPQKLAEKRRPVEKARAGNEAKDAKSRTDFSLSKISALLDREAPQRRASKGKRLTQVASLGAPNAHAQKMSPSMMAALDGWLIDHYRGCWSYFGLGSTQDYVPAVKVRMAQDGSLIGRPALLNPPSDPNLRSLADSAIRAVNRCNPMDMPERFKPFYEAWRERTVRFDPKEM